MSLLITAGTYERLLYGLEYKSAEKTMKESFVYPAHISCIKSLASTTRFLATGATDEHIKLYDLVLRKEVGSLLHHQGSISTLLFVGHVLVCGSEDGNISLVRTSDWELLKILKGHVGAVLAIDSHSSGKVLLSVGKDMTLKCWDLTRGLLSYSLKLVSAPQKVKFASNHFIVLYDHKITIHSLDGEVTGTVESKHRINDGVVINDTLIYGGEDKILRTISMEGVELSSLVTNHKLRIKAIATYEGIIGTASSDGVVKLWKDGENIGEFDTKCRITCLDISREQKRSVKRPKAVEFPESDYDEEKPKDKITVTHQKKPIPNDKRKKQKRIAKTDIITEDKPEAKKIVEAKIAKTDVITEDKPEAKKIVEAKKAKKSKITASKVEIE